MDESHDSDLYNKELCEALLSCMDVFDCNISRIDSLSLDSVGCRDIGSVKMWWLGSYRATLHNDSHHLSVMKEGFKDGPLRAIPIPGLDINPNFSDEVIDRKVRIHLVDLCCGGTGITRLSEAWE